MKLIALIIGLGLERVATDLLKLRELRFFDTYFDLGVRQAARAKGALRYLWLLVFLALPLVPVWLVSRALLGGDTWNLSFLVFAVLVVFFCLGPRDLASEVDEYCEALAQGDEARARRVRTELAESEDPDGSEMQIVEEAIFEQATNRLFAVVLLFVLLGPVGAWLFRVNDLFRRRVAFEAARDPRAEQCAVAIDTIHGVLVWVPARLAALGYALGGSFDEAIAAWRGLPRVPDEPFHRESGRLVATVGRAAMAGMLAQPSNSSAAARNALRLVKRTLFIWLIAVAAVTIFGWAV